MIQAGAHPEKSVTVTPRFTVPSGLGLDRGFTHQQF